MSSFLKSMQQSYESIGAFDSDYVCIYSDFRYFSQYVSELGGKNEFCDAILKPFVDRGQTVIIPTFTYTKTGKFDVLSTPTNLGALNKWILKQGDVKRSEHPLFSCAAKGKNSEIVCNIGKSAFGHNSIFDRFNGINASYIHFGRPVEIGNTVIHYIEQYCGATYRVQKAFDTKVYRGDTYIGNNYSAFLRRLDVKGCNFYSSFRKALKYLQDAKIICSTGDDNLYSTISCYKHDDSCKFLYDLFEKDHNIFIDEDFIQY